MNSFFDFARYKYSSSYSFANFSGKSRSSIKNPKRLSLYLSAGNKNSEVSTRSFIKHEFKLTEFQRFNSTDYNVYPSRRDEEFGYPYLKPFAFKYLSYWNFYNKKSFFFSINWKYLDRKEFFNFKLCPEIFSTSSSFFKYKYFNKRFFFKSRKSFFRRSFKFFRLKRSFIKYFRWKKGKKPFVFNFRSNGIFFSYKPIFFKFNIFKFFYFNNYYIKKFNSFFNFNSINSNFVEKYNNSYIFSFLFSEKIIYSMFFRRRFEISKIFPLSLNFSKNKLKRFKNKIKFNLFNKNKFIKKTQVRYRKKFSRKKRFPFFTPKKFKIINNFKFFNTFIKFKKFFFSFKIFFRNIKTNSFFINFSTKFNLIFKSLKFIFSYKFKFGIFQFNLIFKSLKFIFTKIFKIFTKFINFFKFKKIKFSKYFYNIFLNNNFKQYYGNSNYFNLFNLYAIDYSNLIFFNKFYINFISLNNFKSSSFFSIFYFIFFKINHNFFKINFKKNKSFDKYFNIKTDQIFVSKNFNFINFCDFYFNFYNSYNIFSSSRYSDINKYNIGVIKPSLYSYKVSSTRISKKKSIFSLKKVSSSTLFNI